MDYVAQTLLFLKAYRVRETSDTTLLLSRCSFIYTILEFAVLMVRSLSCQCVCAHFLASAQIQQKLGSLDNAFYRLNIIHAIFLTEPATCERENKNCV